MKDLLVTTLNNIALLEGRVWQAGALGHGDVPANPEWPFCLFRHLGAVPYPAVQDTSRTARHDYLIYIYDERGSYKRIEELLEQVRETLLSKVGATAPSGVQCSGVEWFGTSGDLVEKDLNSNTKYATIRITANL